MTRGILLAVLAIYGLAVASGPPTRDEWETSVRKKVPLNGTLAGSGKFKMLCQCTDSTGNVFLRAGAIETFDDSGILRAVCAVPRFNPDGSLLDVVGCFDFVPLSKP
jgi:hypothetical protein